MRETLMRSQFNEVVVVLKNKKCFFRVIYLRQATTTKKYLLEHHFLTFSSYWCQTNVADQENAKHGRHRFHRKDSFEIRNGHLGFNLQIAERLHLMDLSLCLTDFDRKLYTKPTAFLYYSCVFIPDILFPLQHLSDLSA